MSNRGYFSEKQIIIFGYGFEEVKLYREPADSDQYEVIGFADNSPYKQHKNVIGEELEKSHILHDIINKYPLPDNSIYSYQAEDVLEYVEFEKLLDSINEIYRILQKYGLLTVFFLQL